MDNKDIIRIMSKEIDYINRKLWKYNIVMFIANIFAFLFLYACIALIGRRLNELQEVVSSILDCITIAD